MSIVCGSFWLFGQSLQELSLDSCCFLFHYISIHCKNTKTPVLFFFNMISTLRLRSSVVPFFKRAADLFMTRDCESWTKKHKCCRTLTGEAASMVGNEQTTFRVGSEERSRPETSLVHFPLQMLPDKVPPTLSSLPFLILKFSIIRTT